MKTFLKYTLATITGIIITSFLFFLILIAGLSTMMISGDKPASIIRKFNTCSERRYSDTG